MMRKLKNRSKSSAHKESENEFFTKSITLPFNFAEDLLNLEMELEQDQLCIEDLNKLVELYTKAIEYFESKNDIKYRIFQNKLQSLWMKKSVNNAMDIAHSQQQKKLQVSQQKISPMKSKLSPIKKKKIIELESSLKKKAIDINLKCMNQQNNIDENVQLMILSHKDKVQKCSELIKKEIENQKDNILQRFQDRKNKLKKNTQIMVESINENQKIDDVIQNYVINHENQQHQQSRYETQEKQIRKIYKSKNHFYDKENKSSDQSLSDKKMKREKTIFSELENHNFQNDFQKTPQKNKVNEIFDQLKNEKSSIKYDSDNINQNVLRQIEKN